MPVLVSKKTAEYVLTSRQKYLVSVPTNTAGTARFHTYKCRGHRLVSLLACNSITITSSSRHDSQIINMIM